MKTNTGTVKPVYSQQKFATLEHGHKYLIPCTALGFGMEVQA